MDLRPGKIILGAVIAAATCASASTVFGASEYVVVAVDPPADIPPLGKLYKLGDLVHIEQGSTVTLMGDDGAVTALHGPADVVVTDDAPEVGSTSDTTVEDPSRLSALSELLTNAGDPIQSIGASRSAFEVAASSLEPWAIPVQDGSRGCVHDRRLELWREPGASSAVSIDYDREPFVTGLVWGEGSSTLTVSGAMPVDIRAVTVRMDDQSYSIAIEHLPPAISLQDSVGLYAWMIGNGCLSQASALVRRLAGLDGSR